MDIQEELSSKVYLLDGKTFDFARVSLVSESGKERVGSGLLIPKFKQRAGAASLTFAIDLGTSNTHIEYSSGDDQLPKPLNLIATSHSSVCFFQQIVRWLWIILEVSLFLNL